MPRTITTSLGGQAALPHQRNTLYISRSKSSSDSQRQVPDDIPRLSYALPALSCTLPIPRTPTKLHNFTATPQPQNHRQDVNQVRKHSEAKTAWRGNGDTNLYLWAGSEHWRERRSSLISNPTIRYPLPVHASAIFKHFPIYSHSTVRNVTSEPFRATICRKGGNSI